MSELVMLKNVRIAFANNVFTPKENPGGGAHYKVAAIIEPGSEHQKLLQAALKRAAQTKWAEKADGILRKLAADRKLCYSSKSPTNEEGDVYNGFEGDAGVLNASRNTTKAEKAGAPLVIGAGVNGKAPITKADGKIYSGAYVNLSVDIWAQDNQHGKRLNADFRGLQWVSDGEALGGDGAAPTSADEFEEMDRSEELTEALDNGAPADIDDDIPF